MECRLNIKPTKKNIFIYRIKLNIDSRRKILNSYISIKKQYNTKKLEANTNPFLLER